MPDFIPRRWGDRVNWLNNVTTKIATHGPTLGLAAAKVTEIQNRCTTATTAIQAVTAKENELDSAIAGRATTIDAEFSALRTEFNSLKTNSAMTPAIATDLQIVGTTTAFDPNTFKPELSGSVVGGGVEVRFKKGQTGGVNISTRLRGQTAWTFLARDTNSPYLDNRPLAVPGTPEVREYLAYGVVDDQQIGLPSDIVSVTFAG